MFKVAVFHNDALNVLLHLIKLNKHAIVTRVNKNILINGKKNRHCAQWYGLWSAIV